MSSRHTDYSFFNLNARWRCVVSTKLRPVCLLERNTLVLYRRLGGPQGGLHNTGKFHPCWLLYTPALCTLYAVTCSDCRWTSYGVRMKFIESNIILAYFLFIYLHLRKNICPCVVNHYQLCKLLLSHELKSCILQTSSLFTPELLIYALYDVTMSKTV